jgi:hypothetical protein
MAPISSRPRISADITALRAALAQAEYQLRQSAELEAVRVADAERVAWRSAREACLELEQIRKNAISRLQAIQNGGPERFRGEGTLARGALDDVEAWERRDSAAYTILSFACLRDRLRYLRGGSGREAVLVETLACNGVHTERGYFQEILL